MIKRNKDTINKDKYFDKRYFIRPFICTKCKNEFWFEHGMRPDNSLEVYLPGNYKPKDEEDWSYWYDSSDIGKRYFRYINRNTKFCDICSKDLEYIVEKYPKKKDLTAHLALWLDGTPVEKL
jgi:hypothetical protein